VEQGPEALRGFEEALLKQAEHAVQEAALLCLVADGREGLTPFDRHLAAYLRRTGKPLLLVVNKIDGPEKADLLVAEFHSLGLDLIPCSAAHGYNMRDLEDEMRQRIFTDQPTGADPVLTEDEEALIAGAPRRLRKALREAALGDRAEAAEPTDPYLPDLPDEEGACESFEPGTLSEQEQEDLLEAELSAAEQELAALRGREVYGEALEDDLLSVVPDSDLEEEGRLALPEGPLRLALLGRPNAGKSSLVNAMVGTERMIVSDQAGTTRDSVDVDTVIDGEPCTFVDTAGVRRRAKITDTVERYSVNSSLKSTTKADVTLLLLEATEGVTQQDKRLIDLLYERKTPFMVLVNKVDLLPARQRKEIEKDFAEALVFCPHVPLIFISALKKRNLRRIVPLARQIHTECAMRVGTGRLNRAMEMVLERHQPPVVRRLRPKFFYLTQAESLPPTFVFFVNDAERILPSYARYLERSLRKIFSIVHAPVRVHFRSSHKKRERKK
jgi:GTP-binding protein